MDTDKATITPIAWVVDGSDCRDAAGVNVDGGTVEGMILFDKVANSRRNRKVRTDLHGLDQDGRGGAFERLEWRVIEAHANGPNAPTNYGFGSLKVAIITRHY